MKYDRMIHDYLDGTLDQTSEDALFASMSGNAELRNDFNTYMKINSIATMDMQRISVPSDVTGAVFGRLGISAPGVASMQIAENSSPAFLRKYSGLILLLMLLFTAGTSVYLLQENNNLKQLVSNFTSKNSSIPIMESISNDAMILENAGQNEMANSATGEANKTLNSSAKANNPVNYKAKSSLNNNSNFETVSHNDSKSDSGNNLLASNNEITDVLILERLSFSGIFGETYLGNSLMLQNSKSDATSLNSSGFRINNQDGFVYNPSQLYGIYLSKWSIQLRRTSSQNSYPPVIVGDETNFLTDYSIGVLYHFSKDISAGIEAGNELFSQEFSVNNLNYTQAPMLFWAGVTVRYNPKEYLLPYTLNPYILQTFAGTSVGPLSRTQLGITFSIIEPITFFAGYEYSHLVYNVGGEFFGTGKSGITGGININFR